MHNNDLTLINQIIDDQERIIEQSTNALQCMKSLLTSLVSYNDTTIEENRYYESVNRISNDILKAQVIIQSMHEVLCKYLVKELYNE